MVKKPILREARLDVGGDETERGPAAEQVVLCGFEIEITL